MMTSSTQQALADTKSSLFARTPKLPLPTLHPVRGYDTPYLRRRQHSRAREC